MEWKSGSGVLFDHRVPIKLNENIIRVLAFEDVKIS